MLYKLVSFIAFGLLLGVGTATAQERLCDSAYEDCRQPLLNLINAETVGIDVAFWFIEDKRYSDALIKRFKAGVPVRVLIDLRSSDNGKHPMNLELIESMAAAGIPMRRKNGAGILHWKLMLFAGQNMLQFGAANYNPNSFVASVPYENYIDEAIYFTDDSSLLATFKTKFEDKWIDLNKFSDYANITHPLTRKYPVSSKDPSLNFPPSESYVNRAVSEYQKETGKIDVQMFRLMDGRHVDEMIAAVNRGVPVRLISDKGEYRNSAKPETAYNVDRMYAAGVQIKMDNHLGDAHQKSIILYNRVMVIWGSSNWTTASTSSQEEHNYFTRKSWFLQWFVNQFEWKWNHATAFKDFVPQPPGKPAYASPANGATGQPTTVTLTWQGGPWAHKYDIHFGTSSSPPLFASDVVTGSFTTSAQETFTVNVNPGTTYYWCIVSKTMAGKTAKGPVWSFTTEGTPPPPAPASLTAVAVSTSRIDLAWTDVTGETGYSIERSQDGVSGWTELASIAADLVSYQDTSGLQAGRTYYYRIRAFNQSGHSPYSNTASATTPSSGQSPMEIVLYAAEASITGSDWRVTADTTAAGGARIENLDKGAGKIGTAKSSPASYFEMTFNAVAGTGYRLWIRGKAQNDHYNNDSAHVQFSGSVTSTGSAIYRIGTTSSTVYTLEGCSGCGVKGWGWEDNGWNGLGPLIYFSSTGTQTIRIQVREDGLSMDQIVLSPSTYLNSAPGAQKNDTTILPRTTARLTTVEELQYRSFLARAGLRRKPRLRV